MADKIKKLSEAIRLGATFRPQCVGELFFEGKSCALGAAMEAVGLAGPDTGRLEPSSSEWKSFKARFGLADKWNGLTEAIIERNDILGQSRETIADWLEEQGL